MKRDVENFKPGSGYRFPPLSAYKDGKVRDDKSIKSIPSAGASEKNVRSESKGPSKGIKRVKK